VREGFYDRFFDLTKFVGSRIAHKQQKRVHEASAAEHNMAAECVRSVDNSWFKEMVQEWVSSKKGEIISNLSKGDDFQMGRLKAMQEVSDHLDREIRKAREIRGRT
jgi:hypothetical protein